MTATVTSRAFLDNDVAIVGMGAVLPGASNPEEFWQNCLARRSSIAEVSELRLKRRSNEVRPGKTSIQSHLSCEISPEIYQQILKRQNLDPSQTNRLHAYLFEATAQALADVKGEVAAERKSLIIGCMNPDGDYEKELLVRHAPMYLQELSRVSGAEKRGEINQIEALVQRRIASATEGLICLTDNFYTNKVLQALAQKFSLAGDHFVIDAACASSLVAVDIAIQRLKLGDADLVLTGGVESNLGYGAYMAFSLVGALAPEHSIPFDKRSQGIVQGEGAVVYALKRLSDAVRDRDTIHAVIRGVAGSSDGRSASLFQPNVQGQGLVYRQLYQQDRRLDYLEAHGTGTPVGDMTEMESITSFFAGQRFPVGSSKALVGHTKATAGAVGMLKALFIINQRMIPPAVTDSRPVFTTTTGPYVNDQVIQVSGPHSIRVGVNSFGFGGTNYHVLLEEFDPSVGMVPSTPVEGVNCVVVAESSVDLQSFRVDTFLEQKFPFRIPPKLLESTDEIQLAALLGAWQCIRQLGAVWDLLPREKICVVSGCSLFLDKISTWLDRFGYEILQSGQCNDPTETALQERLFDHIAGQVLPRYTALNEDSTPGVLNNIIAGRVCNSFDLFGKSYNIDKDLASSVVVRQCVLDDLRLNPDQLFVCIAINETADPERPKTIRHSIDVELITSQEFALRNELSAVANIHEVKRES